jgi:phage host-nuclease inhibitor protein Gam
LARPKKATAELASIEDANSALHALLMAEVELEKQQGAMDLARAKASADYEEPIDKQKARIADLTLQLQLWYMANYRTLEEGDLKSKKLHYGTVGRRLSHPALKPLTRAWTWAAIAVKIRSVYNARFFRAVDPEIDKELIRAELTEEQLATVGLKVKQDEDFYAKTDRTALGAGE